MSDEKCDVDIKAVKRAHHRDVERHRSNVVKQTSTSLRDAGTCLQLQKASRARILEWTTAYIESMRRKNSERLHSIEELRREELIDIEALEKLKMTRSASTSADCTPNPLDLECDSASDGSSDSAAQPCGSSDAAAPRASFERSDQ
ncbi:protein max-like [Dermacentor andersoni]|uniref:protein max-like n=1 Tax=Dermacentor andersoni TaxID=34620 RepID=UPI002155CDF3|nr:protein max-like [Dermacentor andersoni]